MYKWRILTSLWLLSVLVLEVIYLRDLPDISPQKIYANSSFEQDISSETNNNSLPERRKTAPEIRKALRKLTWEKYQFEACPSGDISIDTTRNEVYCLFQNPYTEYYTTFDKRIILSSFLIHLHSPPII